MRFALETGVSFKFGYSSPLPNTHKSASPHDTDMRYFDQISKAVTNQSYNIKG